MTRAEAETFLRGLRARKIVLHNADPGYELEIVQGRLAPPTALACASNDGRGGCNRYEPAARTPAYGAWRDGFEDLQAQVNDAIRAIGHERLVTFSAGMDHVCAGLADGLPNGLDAVLAFADMMAQDSAADLAAPYAVQS
jgi:hypothetical protein